LESEGILVNDPEPTPVYPYMARRAPPQHSHVTPSDFDQQMQFLTLDGKVTRRVPGHLSTCFLFVYVQGAAVAQEVRAVVWQQEGCLAKC